LDDPSESSIDWRSGEMHVPRDRSFDDIEG